VSHAEITMKSGAVVTFDCVKLRWQKGAIKGLSWVDGDNAKRSALHVNIDEIAAVVFVDDEL
jgi:hypothetical protein